MGDSVNYLKKFAERWNYLYPLDKWYRTKYKIPFNSTAHREANFIDMRIEFEEELLFKNHKAKAKRKEDDLLHYQTTGDWLKKPSPGKVSDEELDADFEELDWSNFND